MDLPKKGILITNYPIIIKNIIEYFYCFRCWVRSNVYLSLVILN